MEKRKRRFEVSNKLEFEVFNEEVLRGFWITKIDSWNVVVFDKDRGHN